MAQDIENSEIRVEDVITVTEQCYVTGTNGTVFSFLPLRQYIKCGETNPVYVGCGGCKDNQTMFQAYYEICIDGEQFLVSKDKACIEGFIRTENQQDLYKHWRNKHVDNIKDYIQAVKDNTGRTINTGEPDIANQAEYNRIQRIKGRNNGKQYGSVWIEPNQ